MDQASPRRERAWGSALAEKRIEHFYWLGALLSTIGVRLYLFKNYYTINNDGVLYIEAARHFWEGEWAQGLASFYPPGFPLIIAAAYPLVGDWELAGQFWPFVLGMLLIVPLFLLLRRFYGPRVALVALFCYAVSPYLARMSLHVRSEIPYIFFILLAFLLLQHGMDGWRLFSFFLMGMVSAISYLIRPEGVGLVMIASLYLFYKGWKSKELGKSLLGIAVLLVGFALFFLPYVLYLRWDSGAWMISRKTELIVSMGLAAHDPAGQEVALKDVSEVSVVRLIASHPFFYAKKVSTDSFRSLGVYFEAVHYSYLPFLFLGWFLFFRRRFWEREDFIFFLYVAFYLMAFAILHVNRRNAIPLIPISLGWVGVGYLVLNDYARVRWRRGYLISGFVLICAFIGALPKTLQAIGREKLYLREAGTYLREKPGNSIILTTNARVAFYTGGENRVVVIGLQELTDRLAESKADYVALDRDIYKHAEASLKQGWLLDREFSGSDKESLFVLRRSMSS